MAIDHTETRFMKIATERSVVMRAARIALIVGIVLAIINHADSILIGAVTGSVILKIILTFLVPYCVSTYSSVLAVRDNVQMLKAQQD